MYTGADRSFSGSQRSIHFIICDVGHSFLFKDLRPNVKSKVLGFSFPLGLLQDLFVDLLFPSFVWVM
ncbi:hypothetical protein K1719_023377 [Acacia pycnantha]|nr:hypothetical protein K1719_023377 [Acacia pycnantha]